MLIKFRITMSIWFPSVYAMVLLGSWLVSLIDLLIAVSDSRWMFSRTRESIEIMERLVMSPFICDCPQLNRLFRVKEIWSISCPSFGINSINSLLLISPFLNRFSKPWKAPIGPRRSWATIENNLFLVFQEFVLRFKCGWLWYWELINSVVELFEINFLIILLE